MRVENAEEEKIDLTKSLKDTEESEEMIEIAKENFEKNFEMRKKNFNQIEKLKKNRWITHDSSKNVVESTDDENEVFKDNIININLDYNVAKDVIVDRRI